MGYYTTALVKTTTQVVGSLYSEADTIVQWLKTSLKDAGWTQVRKVTAEISLSIFALVPGDEITLDSTIYKFYSTSNPPPSGGVPVPINSGDDTNTILNTWGTLVSSNQNWLSTRPTTTSIRFYGDTGSEIENNLLCTLNPNGTIGIWSSDAISTGVGYTYLGGWILKTAFVNSTPLEMKFVTNGASTRINISDSAGVSFFDGFQTTNKTLSLTANKYQFFLYILGEYGGGKFLVASHLRPLGGATFCNYISGPINPVSPDGGTRASLSISGRYYVNVGIGYAANDGTGTTNQIPTLCFPGFGFGKSPTDKLANPLATLDLVRDDGSAIPYEPMVAVSSDSPTNTSVPFGIYGAFWDSLVYPIYGARDSACVLNGKPGIVLLSQVGATANSRGSFVIRTS